MTHSFPTRRASDLLAGVEAGGSVGGVDRPGGHRVEHLQGGYQRPRLEELDLQAAVGGGLDVGEGPLDVLAEHVEVRSEEHTSELESLMRNSYAVFFLKKKTNNATIHKKLTF